MAPALLLLGLVTGPVTAESLHAPPLGEPTGRVLSVSTEPALQAAVKAATPGTTILLDAGRYQLSKTLVLTVADVTIRGVSNDRDDVILVGAGMADSRNGRLRFGIWTNATRTTIANLTIRDIANHAVIINPKAVAPHVYNVRLVNAGQQLLKANPDGKGGGVDMGFVEYSVFEYDTTAPSDYTNGIDVHAGRGWVVRHNLFRNIRAPEGQLAGPAVLFWNRARDTIVDGNTFVNCQRDISLGLMERADAEDHVAGVVRNNVIYHPPGARADVGILVADSPGTRVLHNTIITSGTYPYAIEYRFTGSRGVLVANNLVDAGIRARNGATGTVTNNATNAAPAMFVDAAAGDLHLAPGRQRIINQIPSLPDAAEDLDGEPRRPGGLVDYGADEPLVLPERAR